MMVWKEEEEAPTITYSPHLSLTLGILSNYYPYTYMHEVMG